MGVPKREVGLRIRKNIGRNDGWKHLKSDEKHYSTEQRNSENPNADKLKEIPTKKHHNQTFRSRKEKMLETVHEKGPLMR